METEKDEYEVWANARARKLAQRLSKLSEKDFERYQDFTTRQQERIIFRLGIRRDEDWRLISLEPDQLCALWYTRIRWHAHLIDFLRRMKERPIQPHYATGPGRY